MSQRIGFHENISQFSPLGKQIGLIFGLSPVSVGFVIILRLTWDIGAWNRTTGGPVAEDFNRWSCVSTHLSISREEERNVRGTLGSTWWGHPDPSAPPRKPFPFHCLLASKLALTVTTLFHRKQQTLSGSSLKPDIFSTHWISLDPSVAASSSH